MVDVDDRIVWPSREVVPIDRWILSADIGQAQDPTALSLLHHTRQPLPGRDAYQPDPVRRVWKQAAIERFDVLNLKRLPLGMSYTAQVEHIRGLILRLRERGINPDFALDFTGCGRPVGDMFDHVGMSPAKVLITGGHEASQHGGKVWHVPKVLLISSLEAVMDRGEFKIAADADDAQTLVSELKDFRRKVSESGRAQYEARATAHDDLVLSCAMGVWWAVSRPSVTRQELRV
ncbi:hypothetical protein JQ615_01025 [Bradyrhizobium jicamae]|uniref:Terminase large subunit gp17-like C-terminal domain-containing protein n=1 Tax=Bradyrhizobium jicamae TaxID=280332 RepID=A0ABS5FB00_9BRAD|nr:hypothetical protein [Bradyrhizobium jicamae]MBR0793963.1 hypothetical protein [Bradyrhizobium jicamae]